LNSTVTYFFLEVLGRVALGLGVLQYARVDMERLLILDATKFDDSMQNQLVEALHIISERQTLPIFDEVNQQDRRNLDSIVFKSIGMNTSEIDELYESMLSVIRNRMSKADSL
ncbi:MAG: hypothetical protein U9P49_08085, partial [Thermodesulfobacteriota bacterium]|nr:hypothetical protein [Thermodesulfobacteriota bacterium]